MEGRYLIAGNTDRQRPGRCKQVQPSWSQRKYSDWNQRRSCYLQSGLRDTVCFGPEIQFWLRNNFFWV